MQRRNKEKAPESGPGTGVAEGKGKEEEGESGAQVFRMQFCLANRPCIDISVVLSERLKQSYMSVCMSVCPSIYLQFSLSWSLERFNLI